jgi:hypothetical protein
MSLLQELQELLRGRRKCALAAVSQERQRDRDEKRRLYTTTPLHPYTPTPLHHYTTAYWGISLLDPPLLGENTCCQTLPKLQTGHTSEVLLD